MLLNTRHFGEIEINEADIIDFPEGIPSFEDVKKFVVIGNIEDESPFKWLQGVDNTDLAFVIIDPRCFKSDYIVNVDDEDVSILDIQDDSLVMVYTIVVVPEDMSKMTANLKAPLLINAENSRGKQVVLNNGDYPIKYYFMEELRKIGG